MREILFRGKRKDNGEWVHGYLYITHNREYEIGSYNKKFGIERVTGVVIPETVGQYTGLTDRDGNKIFEGDILAFDDGFGNEVIEGVVKYGAFNCSCCDGVYGWYIDNSPEGISGDIRWLDREAYEDVDLYIVGNIHDNPELVKKGG